MPSRQTQWNQFATEIFYSTYIQSYFRTSHPRKYTYGQGAFAPPHRDSTALTLCLPLLLSVNRSLITCGQLLREKVSSMYCRAKDRHAQTNGQTVDISVLLYVFYIRSRDNKQNITWRTL